ncbi:hypothetical protein [Clostridium frigidicarnis]|uniref:SdpI/YhfL protein family protein n=1 Tax=Clostridium frigidicarnis TaxID=84698 RepID=A0A1I0Z6W3_9CLOT|nr:hypothetical protein [Clostridium frigidicarnis]SFB20856.1 hypothetical protein SAMN04488528_101784 [Clostridium frigidicarnis]
MVYNLLIIFVTVAIFIYLIGLYYFFKQNYNNFFVGLTVGKNNIILLKSNKLNQKDHKKVKFILTVSTVLLIVLDLSIVYFFKSDHENIKFSIIILMYLVTVISKKCIQKIRGV